MCTNYTKKYNQYKNATREETTNDNDDDNDIKKRANSIKTRGVKKDKNKRANPV